MKDEKIDKMKKKIIESFEPDRDVEFNSGFITALALFLEHKNEDRYMKTTEISDMRLYGATDHLYDIEIPDDLPENLKKRIALFKQKCFKHRLEATKDRKIANALFKEAEDILIEIDETIFNTRTVITSYR